MILGFVGPAMLISIVPIEYAEGLVAGIRRILDDHHGVMFVSETHVSRPEYFDTDR